MFIVENNKITNNKELALGKNRVFDLVFLFNDTFADNDNFSLTIGEKKVEKYSFINSGKITFPRVDLSFIQAAESTVPVQVQRNGNEILNDDITIFAEVSGGGGMQDLSNYKGKINLDGESAVAITAQYDLQINALDLRYNGNFLNNQGGLCCINEYANLPLFLSQPEIEYHTGYGSVKFMSETNKIQLYDLFNSTLTFENNSNFGLRRATERRCSTQEIWVTSSTTDIYTIEIPENVQVIGDIPSVLAKNQIHVFVVRCVYLNDKFTHSLAFSHSFTAN